MNCCEVQGLLSSYYDGELSSYEQSAIATHLAECRECARQLATFESCSKALETLTQSAAPAALWGKLSEKLSQDGLFEPASGAYRRNEERPPAGEERPPAGRVRFVAASLALAASLLFVAGFIRWMPKPAPRHEQEMHSHQTAEFSAKMDHYLKTLLKDPEIAEDFLLSTYNGRRVDPDQAVQLVGYRPAVAKGLPAGYAHISTDVLQMPCCMCVKSVCKRRDGSSLVLFEHDDEATEWFGDRTSRRAVCGGEECCLVDLESDRSVAATWKRGARSITVVCARDLNEVDRLVLWLNGNES